MTDDQSGGGICDPQGVRLPDLGPDVTPAIKIVSPDSDIGTLWNVGGTPSEIDVAFADLVKQLREHLVGAGDPPWGAESINSVSLPR